MNKRNCEIVPGACTRVRVSNVAFPRLRLLLAEVAVVLVLASLAGAQSSTGRIVGSVTDPQNAALSNATVTATNVGTNVSWNTKTNDAGSYQILDLPIGQYFLTVEVQGFNKVETHPQELSINQSLRLDLQLKVGTISEKVEVSSQVSQVETLNPTVGGTVTGKPIQMLPLNGRDTLDLALTQPGVAPAPSTGYGSEKGGEFDQGFTIAGSRPDSVTYLLDGGLNNSVTSSNVIFDPNPDAVAEFRILTNNYTAEYGRSGGGTISVVTKSGTNAVHGSVFEYLRNDALNANTYFNKASPDPSLNLRRPVLKRNQFGGTVGGPIKKDKLFFFFAYEGQRQSEFQNDGFVPVYNPQTIVGNFSTVAGNGGPDSHVACFLSGLYHNTGDPAKPDGASCGTPAHTFFQSNSTSAYNAIIDPTKINPVATNYISAGLIPSTQSGLLLSQAPGTNNFNQYTGKADLYATQNDRLSLTIGSQKTFQRNGLSDTNISGYAQNDSFTEQTANLSYLRIFSMSLVNEAHATASRFYHHAATIPNSFKIQKPSDLGVMINSDFPTGPALLQFNSGMRLGYNPNSPRTKSDTVYGISDTLTWVKAKHTLKFGGRLTLMREGSKYITDGNGLFDFGKFGGVSGNDQADFLLGAPDSFTQFAQAQNNEHQKQWSGFVQDEWKVNPRLALTFGLRYEYTSPETDTKGYSYSVIPGLPATSKFPDAPPGLVVPGDKGSPKGWYFPDYKNFAPRFGFAWDPTGSGKTSIRGGVGMFHDTLNGWLSDWNAGGPPWFAGSVLGFNSLSTSSASTALADPYGNAFPSGAIDPYPSKPSKPGTLLASQGVTFPYGSGIAFVDPNLKTPYVYQYNLSVQRQLGSGLVTEVGYVGSSSHKLLTFVDRNPIDPSSIIAGPPGFASSGTRILTEKLGLTPFVNDYASMVAFAGKVNANYNGLLASITKSPGQVGRLGEMFYTVSYTWSHNLDDGSGFNQRSGQVPFHNARQFYGNSDFDVRHRLVFSGGWELPFARMWENGPKRLTRGWSVYPIAFYQSGVPIDMFLNPSYLVPAAPFPSSDPGSSGYGDSELERPNQLTPKVQTFNPRHRQTFTDLNGFSRTGNFYFNPQNFGVDPCIANLPNTCATGFYGTYRRNSLMGPSRVNVNLALEKGTNLVGDSVKLLFRVEAFNILNHAQFRNPGSGTQYSAYDGTLGQVTQTYDPRILQLSLRLAF